MREAEEREWTAIADDVEMLIAVGESLYGKTWQPRFAKQFGIAVSQLHGIVSGKLTLTDAMKERLAEGVEEFRPVVAQKMQYCLTGMTWAPLKWRGLASPRNKKS